MCDVGPAARSRRWRPRPTSGPALAQRFLPVWLPNRPGRLVRWFETRGRSPVLLLLLRTTRGSLALLACGKPPGRRLSRPRSSLTVQTTQASWRHRRLWDGARDLEMEGQKSRQRLGSSTGGGSVDWGHRCGYPVWRVLAGVGPAVPRSTQLEIPLLRICPGQLKTWNLGAVRAPM